MVVAHGLDDPSLATMLLRPYRMELLTPAEALVLGAIAERYGQDWMRELLAEWEPDSRGWYRSPRELVTWIAALPELCVALKRSGGIGVAALLLSANWRWLAVSIERARSATQPSHRAQELDQLSAPIAGLLIGAAASGTSELRDKAIAVLSDGDDTLLPCLVKVLRVLSDAAPERRVGSGFDQLAQHAGRHLEARLARPVRDPDDWSIDPVGACGCELCIKLDALLADPGLRVMDWPLKEPSRRHVHGRIDGHELPVRHQPRRVGRPYTLALAKTAKLFERGAQARQADDADLLWLRAPR